MNIQQKKRYLDFMITATETISVGNVLYMLHLYRKDGPEKAMAAGGVGAIAVGILGVLIYKTETSIYGFSPTWQPIQRK